MPEPEDTWRFRMLPDGDAVPLNVQRKYEGSLLAIPSVITIAQVAPPHPLLVSGQMTLVVAVARTCELTFLELVEKL